MNIVVLGPDAEEVKASVADSENGALSITVASDWTEGGQAGREIDLDQSADYYAPVGEEAFLTLVRSGVDTPVLPIDVGPGIKDIERSSLHSAIDTLDEGSDETEHLQTLTVQADGEEYQGVMDVMAVTAQAAKISEYELLIHSSGETRTLDTVRADGMLAVTPAGTPGYGTAAGGPILDPDLEGLSVMPIGPFRVERDHWVLQPPFTIRVLREEVPVSLLVDDREVGHIGQGTAVGVDWGTPIELITTTVSRQTPRNGRFGLENGN